MFCIQNNTSSKQLSTNGKYIINYLYYTILLLAVPIHLEIPLHITHKIITLHMQTCVDSGGADA